MDAAVRERHDTGESTLVLITDLRNNVHAFVGKRIVLDQVHIVRRKLVPEEIFIVADDHLIPKNIESGDIQRFRMRREAKPEALALTDRIKRYAVMTPHGLAMQNKIPILKRMAIVH